MSLLSKGNRIYPGLVEEGRPHTQVVNSSLLPALVPNHTTTGADTGHIDTTTTTRTAMHMNNDDLPGQTLTHSYQNFRCVQQRAILADESKHAH